MIALTTTTDESKCIPAVFFTNAEQTIGDVAQRIVPAYADKRSIWLSLERMLQTIIVILVMLKPRCFLANVPFGNGMVFVALNFGEFVPVNVYAQAAIA
jgi:hypothetical protein